MCSGVISTDASKTDAELLAMANDWSIDGTREACLVVGTLFGKRFSAVVCLIWKKWTTPQELPFHWAITIS
jgi:hypothetical protein